MNTSLARLAALLMVMALGAAACGSSDTAAPASPGAESTAPAEPEPSILEITAPAADGSTITLSDYAGQDLMLWFWAPW